MRHLILTITVLSLVATSAWCVAPNAAGDSVSTNPAKTFRQRTFFGTIGTIAGQIAVGAMGGMVGTTFTYAHPVAGGVGWILGSSFGVYAIGNAGTGRGSFRWTALAGTGAVIPFIPGMSKGDIGAGFYAAAAMLTSLVAEIVVYYITEAPIPDKLDNVQGATISVSLSSLPQTHPTSTHSIHPCLVFRLDF